ncbi:MAG: hypothetical protein CM1200mP28_18040 [Deltaproteobacteria bacterium]|nr:MAG: hypothetical protein CM1200mP28_18040 [Deltaproteobacteria bacterium]
MPRLGLNLIGTPSAALTLADVRIVPDSMAVDAKQKYLPLVTT